MPDYEKLAEGVEVGAGPVEDNSAPNPAPREFLPINHPKYQGIGEAKGYDQSYGRIVRTHYSHEAMIDVIIAEPTIKQVELARRFEKTEAWISRIIGSDAFQGALAKRREELTDPFLVATIEERFRGLAMQSLDVIADKLETTKNADLALKALDISSKALGFGARGAGQNTTNNNFVIALPPKIQDAAEWAQTHAGGPIIEHKGA